MNNVFAAAFIDALTPGVRELAMLASLARRVEAQLLRALRLELGQTCSAADEADLWFSPVVESRGPTGLVLLPGAVPILQHRLRNAGSDLLDRAWHLLFRLRTGIAYEQRDQAPYSTWLLVQEELTWWAVRDQPLSTADEARINKLFGWIQNSFADERTADDAARWLSSSQVRLPSSAWRLPGAARLRDVASARGTRRIWVRRLKDGIELAEQDLASGHLMEISAPPGPVRVDVHGDDDTDLPTQTALVGRRPLFVPVRGRSVQLRPMDGQAFALDIVETREPPRAVVLVLGWMGRESNGLLVSPRHVLTCVRSVPDRLIGEALDSALGRHGDSVTVVFPLETGLSSVSGKIIARTPLRRLEQPPLTGDLTEMLAIVRLDRAVRDPRTREISVLAGSLDLIGSAVTIDHMTMSTAKGPLQQLRIKGVVDRTEPGGCVVRLFSQDERDALPINGGSPVWLDTGELLGVCIDPIEMSEPDAVLVALAGPLEYLLNEVPTYVLVVGSGYVQISREESNVAQSLGRALASEGFVLVCGGWPGVDHVVARAFAAAIDDDKVLRRRIVRLVERGRQPDLALPVEAEPMDENEWIDAMLQRADIVVAIGGAGGAEQLCNAALDRGVPVLPLPGTGSDAAVVYQALRQGIRKQRFPGRHALRMLDYPVDNEDATDRLVRRVIELIKDCRDESSIALYREYAAVVYGLIAACMDDQPLPSSTFMEELAEAMGDHPAPKTLSEATEKLPRLLHGAHRWLIRDLLAMASDNFAPKAGAALLAKLASGFQSTGQLVHAIREELGNVQEFDRIHAVLRSFAELEPDDKMASLVYDLLTRLVNSTRLRKGLAELMRLARILLFSTDLQSIGETYERLQPSIDPHATQIGEDLASQLMLSSDQIDRAAGYLCFLHAPSERLIPPLLKSLVRESEEVLERHNAKPLWILLRAVLLAQELGILSPHFEPGDLMSLERIRDALQANPADDPGGTCADLLDSILRRPNTEPTSEERFASYSRLMEDRDGRPRYAWCVFIVGSRARLDAIAEVEYTLHHTFPNQVRTSSDAENCFVIFSEAWGEFTLKILLRYKSGASVRQTFDLKLQLKSWPLGTEYRGDHSDALASVYAALCDPLWEWRTEAALARETQLSARDTLAALRKLAAHDYARMAQFASRKNKPMWGATSRVGLAPRPTD